MTLAHQTCPPTLTLPWEGRVSLGGQALPPRGGHTPPLVTPALAAEVDDRRRGLWAPHTGAGPTAALRPVLRDGVPTSPGVGTWSADAGLTVLSPEQSKAAASTAVDDLDLAFKETAMSL